MVTNRIVVGVGDAQDLAPLGWAFAESRVRQAALDVVHAWRSAHDVSPIGIPGPALDSEPYRAAANDVVDRAIAEVAPELRRDVAVVQPLAVQDQAGKALLDVSMNAELLVVGSRKRGAIRALLGSVSHQCVHHATCPVAVVPPEWDAGRHAARIVVGVDGSAGSAGALRWALDEAALWGSEVAVVHVWTFPVTPEAWGAPVPLPDRGVLEQVARELAGDMVEQAVAAGAARPEQLSIEAVEGRPGPALVAAAGDADLIVVGSRGRGGFMALLVGSTSLDCLHLAPCPVVVVPPPRDEG